MKIEEIQQQCEALSNEQLFLVVNNKRLYTEKIVRVAYQEIKKRGLSKQEAKEIEKKQAQRSEVITGDIYEDIFFWEKLGLFYLGIIRIMSAMLVRDYQKQGFILKVRQSKYYILLGIAFLILGGFLGQYFHSGSTFLIVWAAGFPLSHLFNKFYFKAATIKRLEARTGEPDNG